jgi:hypothetical protein
MLIDVYAGLLGKLDVEDSFQAAEDSSPVNNSYFRIAASCTRALFLLRGGPR